MDEPNTYWWGLDWIDEEADVDDYVGDEDQPPEEDDVIKRYRVVVYPKAPGWPRPAHIHLVLARSAADARDQVVVPFGAEIRTVELVG